MRRLIPVPFLVIAACTQTGSNGTPLTTDDPPELLFCRSRSSDAYSDTQIRTATTRGLGDVRIVDRAGVESGVRIAPDGNELAFVRERRSGDRESRELFTATRDGSAAELRLSVDAFFDAAPTWSPDGQWIAFESERLEHGPRIVVIGRDGKDAKALFDDGFDQRAPDWSWTRDRIAFEHVDADGRARIWTVDPAGRDAVPFSTGGLGSAGTGEVPGDHDPVWAPDGASLLFVRDVEPGLRILLRADYPAGTTTQLTTADGHVATPRWSPHGDRLFFVGDRPAAGIRGQRLWTATPDGADRRMIFIDFRHDFVGLDVLPDITAVPTGTPDEAEADVASSVVSNSLGHASRGALDDVVVGDGIVFGIATAPSNDREVAGIEFDVPLPIDTPTDALALRFTAVVGLTEVDATSVLRLSLANFVANRNDTAVEVTPIDSRLQTLSFDIASLQHVAKDRRVRLALIGDNAAEHPGELLIDRVGVRVWRPAR